MSISIQKSHSLRTLNTFGVEVKSSFYVAIHDVDSLCDLLQSGIPELSKILVLGGGSNILFTGDFDGCVLHMCNKGISVEREDDKHVWLRVSAGEEWDDFVHFCLQRNLGGVENLVAIPGRVGAAPVQNIGAYGAEVCNVIEEVNMVMLEDGLKTTMPAAMCAFGYRTSVFKTDLKGGVVITSVLFKLLKKPVVNVGYGDIRRKIDFEGIDDPSIADVARMIRLIRDEKLPDPKFIGNAGSFFKNPVTTEDVFKPLLLQYPEMPVYPQSDGTAKIAAGWLIDQCGLKGFQMGRAAVHNKQALVLINVGQASGVEVVALANHIIKTVWLAFGIRLEPEVNVL